MKSPLHTLQKIWDAQAKIDKAFAQDSQYRTSVQGMAASTLPSIIFTSLWLGLSMPMEYNVNHYVDNCALSLADSQSRKAILTDGLSEFNVVVDPVDAYSCAQGWVERFEAEDAAREKRLSWAAIGSLALFYFSFSCFERARDRFRELDGEGFFRDIE